MSDEDAIGDMTMAKVQALRNLDHDALLQSYNLITAVLHGHVDPESVADELATALTQMTFTSLCEQGLSTVDALAAMAMGYELKVSPTDDGFALGLTIPKEMQEDDDEEG